MGERFTVDRERGGKRETLYSNPELGENLEILVCGGVAGRPTRPDGTRGRQSMESIPSIPSMDFMDFMDPMDPIDPIDPIDSTDSMLHPTWGVPNALGFGDCALGRSGKGFSPCHV